MFRLNQQCLQQFLMNVSQKFIKFLKNRGRSNLIFQNEEIKQRCIKLVNCRD